MVPVVNFGKLEPMLPLKQSKGKKKDVTGCYRWEMEWETGLQVRLRNREARLQQMCTHQRQEHTRETAEAIKLRLQSDRQRHQQQRSTDPGVPLLDQPNMRAKLHHFHASLASLEASTCTTCFEALPRLPLTTQSLECKRCANDGHIPKLYSIDNDMHPGPVPPQLQVGYLLSYFN